MMSKAHRNQLHRCGGESHQESEEHPASYLRKEHIDQGQVFGARITGDCSGENVGIFARSGAVIQEIKAEYESNFE